MYKPIAFLLLMSGCVNQNVARQYAERAHPECSQHKVISHNYGGESGSQTEVSMLCGDERRSITIKCVFGFSIISDTTCHENN